MKTSVKTLLRILLCHFALPGWPAAGCRGLFFQRLFARICPAKLLRWRGHGVRLFKAARPSPDRQPEAFSILPQSQLMRHACGLLSKPIPRVGNLEDFLTKTGTQAFIVIRDDAILYEKYFNGAKRDSTVVSFSTAKSFTSALVGIAIQEGGYKKRKRPHHRLPA